jgi:hypothetical protein
LAGVVRKVASDASSGSVYPARVDVTSLSAARAADAAELDQAPVVKAARSVADAALIDAVQENTTGIREALRGRHREVVTELLALAATLPVGTTDANAREGGQGRLDAWRRFGDLSAKLHRLHGGASLVEPVAYEVEGSRRSLTKSARFDVYQFWSSRIGKVAWEEQVYVAAGSPEFLLGPAHRCTTRAPGG